jgi:hypothetical protein
LNYGEFSDGIRAEFAEPGSGYESGGHPETDVKQPWLATNTISG